MYLLKVMCDIFILYSEYWCCTKRYYATPVKLFNNSVYFFLSLHLLQYKSCVYLIKELRRNVDKQYSVAVKLHGTNSCCKGNIDSWLHLVVTFQLRVLISPSTVHGDCRGGAHFKTAACHA